MGKQIISSIMCTAAVLAGTIGLAGPAAAAQDPTPTPAPASQWVMPNVRGMILQRAMNEIFAVTGTTDLDIRTQDTKGTREQINLTNWTVCGQSPRAGSLISQKTKRVIMTVKRSSDQTC